MSGNVYLCYTGEYEDRAVSHVSSTRELAVAWIDQQCGCGRIHGEESPTYEGEVLAAHLALDEVRRLYILRGWSKEREAALRAAQARFSDAVNRWEAEVRGPWFRTHFTHCVEWEIEEEEVDAE